MLCSDADFMTEYVVTRWYRAPELLLSCERYDAAIDIWSVGCILAELFLRKPLFQGKDYLSQLKIIIEVLGSPSDEELTFVTAPRARQFIRDLKGIQAGTPQLLCQPAACIASACDAKRKGKSCLPSEMPAAGQKDASWPVLTIEY